MGLPERCTWESKRSAPVIRSRGIRRPSCPTLRPLVLCVHDLGSPQLHTQILLLPRARKHRPSPTSHRTPELLLGAAGTGEPRATPLVQWKAEDEVQGRGLREHPCGAGLYIWAFWDPAEFPGVFRPQSQSSLSFPGPVSWCAWGHPGLASQDYHQPGWARDPARTLADLLCSHSLNALGLAAP